MPTTALLLVLAAAVLHSTWNALTKRARHHLCFLWLAVTLASVLAAPLALTILTTRGVSPAAWPYVLATIALHALYFYALGRAYHSGDSEEVNWLLGRLRPDSAIGISLGGNALLKWLGERGAAAKLRRAAAVSAPIDLPAAGAALDRGLNRLLYTRYFLATLKPKSLAKLGRFPGLYDAARVRAARRFRDFDDVVTAPLHGFRDTDHYWQDAASGPWLEHIRVPTLLLNARNDPFLPEHALLAATQKAAPCVVLEFPRTGGHVGFVSGPFPGHHGWLTTRLLDFLEQ